MRVEDVRKVGVVGAGVMGTQIGELFAQKGFRVSMVDIDQKALIRSRRQIESKLRNRLFMVPSRISWSLDLYEAVKDVDLVVETVTEDLNLKVRIFAQLDQSTPKHAILVSNSSTFPITWIVDKVSEERRAKCANLHFMNPVGASKIVEVVKGTYTSDETIQVLEALVRKLGKKPIVLKKETPGFIINRVLGAILRESYRLLEEGVASAEEIDEALKLGLWLPMGPFRLSDLIGIDVIYYSMKSTYDLFKLEYLRPPNFLKEMVERGELGMKTKKGFYTY